MRSRFGPKLYCVVVKQTEPDGSITIRPMRSPTEPGAFPDGSMSRFQARKLLRKAARHFPQARLLSHRTVL